MPSLSRTFTRLSLVVLERGWLSSNNVPGMTLRLGPADWHVHSAPGHDPVAIMLFQPEERVLISGDALWQHGVAILFPEFSGGEGFEGAHRALGTIERLAPRIVIPGHGAPFVGTEGALLQSRARLQTYERHPEKHRDYSGRALLMFHMLEHRGTTRAQLVAWASSTRVFQHILPSPGRTNWIEQLVDRLVSTGALQQAGERLYMPGKGKRARFK